MAAVVHDKLDKLFHIRQTRVTSFPQKANTVR
jgi:hypothetical protein